MLESHFGFVEMLLLIVTDEYIRESLMIMANRHIGSSGVIETLTELMVAKGVANHIRLDNGPEFKSRGHLRAVWKGGC